MMPFKQPLTLVMMIGVIFISACQPAAQTATPVPTHTLQDRIGKPIKVPDQGTVFRVMPDLSKRAIVDWGTYLAYGYAPGDIVELPKAEVARYPAGDPLTRLVRSGETLYLMHGGARYQLPDAEVQFYQANHLLPVTTLPETVLQSFPIGTRPYPAPAHLPGDIVDGKRLPPATVLPALPDSFPSPLANYADWIATWPRPADDNGWCIHYLQFPSGDDFEVRQQIARMWSLGVKWVVVNYVGREQLLQLAPLFARSGLIVIWRPFVRPAQIYAFWAEDVRYLRSLNLPPYIQVYNEPSLAQEWNEKTPDQTVYLTNFSSAAQAVYDAGGYVGMQQIDVDWLRTALRYLKSHGQSALFSRLFFVPHSYGFNHPPNYTEDQNGVLGFRWFARVFQDELGFIPVMIAGEGGWRPGEQQDSRYPAISESLHRDYHLAVLDWFRMGKLSDGKPLPDYLLAFCPWLLADTFDAAAWYDARSGDHTLTIQAVQTIAPFTRRFSGNFMP